AASEAFYGGSLPLGDSEIASVLESVRVAGRAEQVPGNPATLLDGAHNEAAAIALRALLDDHFPGAPVVLLFGANRDKDIAAMLRGLRPRITATVFTEVSSPRAARIDALRSLGRAAGIRSEAVAAPAEALARARAVALEKKALLLVTGSLYLVGELR